MNEIKVITAEQFGLEEKEATNIEKAFEPKIKEREILHSMFTEIIKKDITFETCGEAKELRRKLAKVRTGIADIHRTQKAFFLAAGRFVDAWKNKETIPVTQMEDSLKKIENHFAEIEAEKLAKIRQERTAELDKYETVYDAGDIALLDDVLWGHFLNGVKADFEAKKAEEKKAEAERIAKEKAVEVEQKRIKAENERLKKEAEAKRIADEKAEKERQRLNKIEQDRRDKIERERIAKAEVERKERQEKEAKERAAHESELKKEREEKARIQKELEAKAEAERKRKRAEQIAIIKAEEEAKAKAEQQRLLELAPVKDKLKRWINETEISDPTNKDMDKETFEMVEDIMTKFNKFKIWAKGEIEKVK